jgi:hypothetical protein
MGCRIFLEIWLKGLPYLEKGEVRKVDSPLHSTRLRYVADEVPLNCDTAELLVSSAVACGMIVEAGFTCYSAGS